MPNKQILLLHTNGTTVIDQELAQAHCDHRNTTTIKAGYQYTIAGEATDDTECFEMCLDCGMILNDNREWVMPDETQETDEIPY